jgi:hypothetical protein
VCDLLTNTSNCLRNFGNGQPPMTQRKLQDRQASQIRTNIKAAIAQLDSWTASQESFRRRRNAGNATSGGHAQRCIDARNRATSSQGTQFIEDSPCSICGSSSHLSDECDFIAVESSTKVSFEAPSTGIHRGIVHKVFALASDLYRLHYPRFYPGPSASTLVSSDAYLLPVPLVGPDYQEIGISKAVASLVETSSARNYLKVSFLSQRSIVDAVAQPYHSAAFPLDYTSFRDKIQERLFEELDSNQRSS